MYRMHLNAFILLILAFAMTGCGNKSAEDAKKDTAKPVLLSQADLITLNPDSLGTGPLISGSIQPEKLADLRAEVSSVVLQVYKDNGDKVKKDDLLVRLDDTAIRDALNSARESERAFKQAFEQAERQLIRLTTLSSSGAVSKQALEDTQIRRDNAQSDWVAARARVAQARQQLERTEVRAPFNGIISSREVSNGDTVQIGKALLMVIDPSSVRFEGFVPAEQGAQIQPGLPVRFRISGYGDKDFSGKVQRVNPMANAVTRQIAVIVAVDWETTPIVSGLYAEGRIEITTRDTFMLPPTAIVMEGDRSFVWQAQDKVLRKTAVNIGERDARSGRIEITQGVVAGQTVLRIPSSGLTDGAAYEMQTDASIQQAKVTQP